MGVSGVRRVLIANHTDTMANNKDFQQFLLENGDNPEIDVVLQKMLDDVPRDGEGLAAEGFREFRRRTGIKPRIRGSVYGRVLTGVAASLFIPALLLSFWSLHRVSEMKTDWVSVSTGVAQTKEISLSDGTRVSLKPCSQLFYPEKFSGRERKVMLGGEAYLEVARDERKKFVVNAGDMDIVVHGTRFNVSSFPGDEEDEVALLEGSVEMKFNGVSGSIFLSPGELVKYDKVSGTAERRRFATNYYDEVITAGGLQFNNERLSDITATLNRHFGVNIVIGDKTLAAERYFASFINGEGVDEILAALKTGGHFRIVKQDNIISLKR